MKRRLKWFLYIFYKAADDAVEHDGIEFAGYLAFLGMLAFFPFLVFFVSIAGFIGETQVSAAFYDLIIQKLPTDITAAIQPRINEIISGPPQGLVTLSIVGTIWTSSSAVEGMRGILNRAYRVSTPPSYLWRRMMAILQLVFMAVITFIVMLLVIFAPVFLHDVAALFGIQDAPLLYIWNNIRLPLGSLIIFFMVGFSYYLLPNIKQSFLAVVPGTIMVLILWLGCAELLSVYLTTFNQINIVYGSLGGMMVALIFFFVLAMVYIYGAEFNYQIERFLGKRIVEKEHYEEGDKK